MMIWLSIIAMPASARPSAVLRPKRDPNSFGILVSTEDTIDKRTKRISLTVKDGVLFIIYPAIFNHTIHISSQHISALVKARVDFSFDR